MIVDLLISMGLRIVRAPSRGMAEHGLDVAAIGRIDGGPRTLYLLQVKQGDITRATWNQGVNSVRASLDDLVDHVDEFLVLAGRPVPARTVLVIAHNGMIAPNVQSSLDNHCRAIQHRNGLEIEHWHLHKLVELFEANLFDEHFFSRKQAAAIRKTLAFVEVPEYDLHHFETFLAETIPERSVSPRRVERTLLQIQIAFSMVNQYGTAEGGNHDVGIRACELGLLRIYGWLHRAELLSDKRVRHHLLRVVNMYFALTLQFLAKIEPCLDVYHGLARTGIHERVEYPLRVLKIGALAGQWMIFVGRVGSGRKISDELRDAGRFLSNFLTKLRGSCPVVERPLFDYQMSDVCLFALGLRISKGSTAVANYLDSVISRMCLEASNDRPLPEGYGDVEAVARLVINETKVDWYSGSSSTLLPMLAEMCALLGANSLYSLIRDTWHQKIDFQNIYLDENFIGWACGRGHPLADSDARTETSIGLPASIEDFRVEIDRKRDLDSGLRKLLKLPFFELIMHVATRTHALRFSPAVWRGLIPDATDQKEHPSD